MKKARKVKSRPVKQNDDTPPAPSLPKIIKDSREQKGWSFEQDSYFSGMVVQSLKTGDYSIEGFEDKICIERKGSANEFVNNLYQKRFQRELDRMAAYGCAVVILEFEFVELAMWHKLHTKIKRVPRHWKIPGLILAKFFQLQLANPHVHFLFVGHYGKEAALSFLKRSLNEHRKTRTA